MEFKFIYLVIIGIVFLFNMYRKFKAQQAEAEKKHPPPPRRTASPEVDTPAEREAPMPTLEDILQRAADESRKAQEARKAERRQRELQQTRQPKPVQPQRTWVNETPKPVRRAATKPFLTTDAAGYRAPQMEAFTTLEGVSQETFGEEGGISISDVHNPIQTVSLEEQAPAINLRQAMLYQVILQRPDY